VTRIGNKGISTAQALFKKVLFRLAFERAVMPTVNAHNFRFDVFAYF